MGERGQVYSFGDEWEKESERLSDRQEIFFVPKRKSICSL
jgi:hypothetical protein